MVIASAWANSGWIAATTYSLATFAPVAGKTYGYKVQARCTGVAGTSLGGVYSSEYVFSTNPAAPSGLSGSTAGTAPYTFNALGWTANTCGTGYTAQYYIQKVVDKGVAGTYENSGWLSRVTSFTIPAAWMVDGAVYGFQIKSRCYSVGYTSPDSPYSTTYSMTTTSYTPGGLTSNNSGTLVAGVTNNRLIWNNITCPTGYTPQYYILRTNFKGAADNATNSGWVAGTISGAQTYYDIPSGWTHQQGATYGYSIQGRCTGAGGTSSNSAASAVYTFTTVINAPAAPTGMTNNGWSTVSWTAAACPAGTTSQSQMYQNRNNGADSSPGTLRMDWSTAVSATASGTAGYGQGAYAVGRCVGANANSAAGPGSATTYWTQSVPSPYSEDIYLNVWRAVKWYANCSVGSPRYRAYVRAAWGAWDSGYWVTYTDYSNTGPAWGTFAMYLDAQCVNNGVASGTWGIGYDPAT